MKKRKNNTSQKSHNNKKKTKIKKAIFVIGTLTINLRKNFGFVTPEDPRIFSQDIFIPQKFLNGAIDGDTVKVKVSLDKKYQEETIRWKGSIEAVLKRNKNNLVGIVTAIIDEKYIEVHTPSLGSEKCIKTESLENYSAAIGDRILIKNPSWEKKKSKEKKIAKMIEFLGNINSALTDRIAIEKEFQITDTFASNVEIEAHQFPPRHVEKLLKEREDLRSLLCFTIDSKTAKDFDDAVSLSLNEKKEYILGVHIADVSYYVKKNSALDKEARERCNSIYFPGHVIPMLPHVLSSNLCSLKPNVNRLAISVFMTLDQNGIMQSYEIKRSIIKSKYRMTYDEVNNIIEHKIKHPLKDNIFLMFELSKKLQSLKEKRGCLHFAIPTIGLKFNSKEEPYDIFYSTQTEAHKIIEEFMLQTNETIAKHAFVNGLTLPYRIHEQPDPLQLEAFREFITSLGLSIQHYDKNNFDYQTLLKNTETHILNYLIHSNFIKSMKMASYSIENKGHYGLHLEYYTHFTSPIRRYIDLCLHRILFNPESISKEDLEIIVKKCSQKERLSIKAEQNFDKIKKIRFFLKLYTENPKKSYSARIISIKQELITFCIPEFLYEDTIIFPYLHSPSEKKDHASKSTSSLFYPGKEICIKIQEVNLIFLKIKWNFCSTSFKKKSKKSYKKRKNDS